MNRDLAELITATLVVSSDLTPSSVKAIKKAATDNGGEFRTMAPSSNGVRVIITGGDSAAILKSIEKISTVTVIDSSTMETSAGPTLVLTLEKKVGRETFGPWELTWLPTNQKLIPKIKAMLTKAERLYRNHGVRFRSVPIHVMTGKARRSHYIRGKVLIYPKEVKTGNVGTLVHELAHYLNDKHITGGYSNTDIKQKFEEAKRTEREPEFPSVFDDGVNKWVSEQQDPEILALFQREVHKAFRHFDKQYRRAPTDERKALLDHLIALDQHIISHNKTLGKHVNKGWFPVQYARRDRHEFFATLVQYALVSPAEVGDHVKAWVEEMLKKVR